VTIVEPGTNMDMKPVSDAKPETRKEKHLYTVYGIKTTAMRKGFELARSGAYLEMVMKEHSCACHLFGFYCETCRERNHPTCYGCLLDASYGRPPFITRSYLQKMGYRHIWLRWKRGLDGAESQPIFEPPVCA